MLIHQLLTLEKGDYQKWLSTGIFVMVDKKPERVFKTTVLVDKKLDWKSEIPVPVNMN